MAAAAKFEQVVIDVASAWLRMRSSCHHDHRFKLTGSALVLPLIAATLYFYYGASEIADKVILWQAMIW
jgi:hypothetical protein